MNSRNLILVLALVAVSAIRAAPVDPVQQSELAVANALFAAKNFSAARAAFEKILARAPDNPDANCVLGLFACDDGDWEKALRMEGIALASDPNNARYQRCWGDANGIAAQKAGVFSRLGYARKCLAARQRAVELEPGNIEYRRDLLNFYVEAPGFAGGDRYKAYAQAGEIGKIDAEAGRQAFAKIYVGEKKYALAFRLYDDALRESPDDYPALYSFGRLTLATGQRMEDGITALRRCLELTPPEGKDVPSRADVHCQLGNLWEKKNQPEQARAEYLAALKERPDFRQAKQALKRLGSSKS